MSKVNQFQYDHSKDKFIIEIYLNLYKFTYINYINYIKLYIKLYIITYNFIIIYNIYNYIYNYINYI